MSAPDGWALLQACLELTERLDRQLDRPELGLSELSEVEQLYRQRQHLLEQLQPWWETAPEWSLEQARKWLDILQQLIERSTRQAEHLRSLLVRSEHRLHAALAQRQLVRYEAQEYDGD